MPADEEYSGQLHRRKGKFGAWKPYIYTIEGCYLYEWKVGQNRLTNEPHRTYPLTGCLVEDAAALAGKSLAFQYHSADDESHIFLAPSKAEKEKWMKMILTAQVKVAEPTQQRDIERIAAQKERLDRTSAGVELSEDDEEMGSNPCSPTTTSSSVRPKQKASPQSQEKLSRSLSLSSAADSSVSVDFLDMHSETSSLNSVGSTTLPVLNFLDSFIDPVVVSNSVGIIVAINQNAERLFGYSKAEAIGQNVNILMPEPYKSQHDAYIFKHEKYGTESMIGKTKTFKGRRKDGSIFPVQISLGNLPHKGYLIATMRNLDEVRSPTHQSKLYQLSDVDSNRPSFDLEIETQVDENMLASAHSAFGSSTVSVHELNPLILSGALSTEFDPEFMSKDSVTTLNPLVYNSVTGLFSGTQPNGSKYTVDLKIVDAAFQKNNAPPGAGGDNLLIDDIDDSTRMSEEPEESEFGVVDNVSSSFVSSRPVSIISATNDLNTEPMLSENPASLSKSTDPDEIATLKAQLESSQRALEALQSQLQEKQKPKKVKEGTKKTVVKRKKSSLISQTGQELASSGETQTSTEPNITKATETEKPKNKKVVRKISLKSLIEPPNDADSPPASPSSTKRKSKAAIMEAFETLENSEDTDDVDLEKMPALEVIVSQ